MSGEGEFLSGEGEYHFGRVKYAILRVIYAFLMVKYAILRENITSEMVLKRCSSLNMVFNIHFEKVFTRLKRCLQMIFLLRRGVCR